MSTRSLKLAAAASVLALGLMVPSAFAWGGGIELEKNCSNGLGLLDTTQCSVNVADPSGYQDVEQKAFNTNVAMPVQSAEQFQMNKQEIDADTHNMAYQGPQIPIAAAVAISGESKAYGHEADVNIFAPQKADAGVEGFMVVKSDTGSADIEHSGNGSTTAIGGNTGNFQSAKSEIEGGYAKAEAEGAIAPGGDGGNAYGANGGDVKGAGNGGWAVDATLGNAESEGGNGGDGGNVGALPDGLNSQVDDHEGSAVTPSNTTGGGGSGGSAGDPEVEGGNATATNSSTNTAGNGGTNNAGAGAMGGTATNIALAKNVGDNANSQAWNNATSGNSTMGNTYGNTILGGDTGHNTTTGIMAGGSAANILGVAVTQSGNVTSSSGAATQNGDPQASSQNCISQRGSEVDQQQNAAPQNSTNNGAPISQSGSNTQSAGQTVSSGKQFAGGLADGGIQVTLPSHR